MSRKATNRRHSNAFTERQKFLQDLRLHAWLTFQNCKSFASVSSSGFDSYPLVEINEKHLHDKMVDGVNEILELTRWMFEFSDLDLTPCDVRPDEKADLADLCKAGHDSAVQMRHLIDHHPVLGYLQNECPDSEESDGRGRSDEEMGYTV